MTQQSGGAGIPLTQGVAGVLSGNILSPAFATNGTTPLLGYVLTQLSADVAMATANQVYDILSIALTTGTWDVHAVFYAFRAGLFDVTAKLWDGTTVYASITGTGSTNFAVPLSLSCPIVLAAPATIKVSAASDGATTSVKAAGSPNGAGNNAATLYAVRIA